MRSSADSAWRSIVLTETNPSTGVFRGAIQLTAGNSKFENRVDDDGDPDTPMVLLPLLRVNDSGRVTMRYNDGGTRRTKAIDVESTEPVLSNFSPAHNVADVDGRPDMSADVTDSDSGVVEAKVFVIFATLDSTDGGKRVHAANNDGKGAPYAVSVDRDGRLKDITGGFSAQVRMPDELDTDEDATIAWWVYAEDMAGNMQVSDQDTSDKSQCAVSEFVMMSGFDPSADFSGGPVHLSALENQNTVAIKDDDDVITTDDGVGKCQPFLVRVDNSDPVLEGAETGVFWDPDKDGSDKTVTDATKAKNTSVRVLFDEALDTASVDRTDFEVDGDTPLDAAHYSGAPSSVFLTVPALDPDETPKVELVGEVADLAGNTKDTGVRQDDETLDGIAPTVTVSLAGVTSGARLVTDKSVVITIETNENTANPTVVIRKITAATADDEGLVDLVGNAQGIPTPKVKGARTYETTFNATSDGLYNVYVTATDGSNPGTSGVSGMMDVDHDDDDGTEMVEVNAPVDLSSDTNAILFEVDSKGPSFVLDDPNTDDPNAESDDPNAFVRIDFSGEGKENPLPVKGPGTYREEGEEEDTDDDYFGRDSLGDDEAVDANEDGTGDTKDVDTYGMVTILSATLKGDDISESLERLGADSFLFVAPNLEVGDYKIVIDAEDEAGNDNEASATLSITERKPFVLTIRAGVSLISFPGDPLDPDINAAFPADHPAQEIITYDPTQPGLWFASKRDEVTGLFDGNLMAISGSQAYLVRSNSTKDVSVVIDRPSSHDLLTPPQIDLVGGWNLVPVTDITYQLKQGGTISYSDYFGDNESINRVYGVDTVRNRLILVSPPNPEGRYCCRQGGRQPRSRQGLLGLRQRGHQHRPRCGR